MRFGRRLDVLHAASGRSCKGGERSVLAGRGRARTCCCFSSSMSIWLTSLRQLGSDGIADLEQRRGHDRWSVKQRPHCGFGAY